MSKNHYHLVAASVIFVTAEQQTGTVNLNVVLASDSQNFPSRQIAKAQQRAQMSFFQKLAANGQDVTDVQVVDVFTQAISYLGEMEEEDFFRPLADEPV